MRTVTLMENVTTDVASSIRNIIGSQRENFTIQVRGSGTYSVVIELSFNGTDFYTIATKTASEVFAVVAAPYIRCTTSGTSGADVSVFAGV